jgi:hypothetical protein
MAYVVDGLNTELKDLLGYWLLLVMGSIHDEVIGFFQFT